MVSFLRSKKDTIRPSRAWAYVYARPLTCVRAYARAPVNIYKLGKKFSYAKFLNKVINIRAYTWAHVY